MASFADRFNDTYRFGLGMGLHVDFFISFAFWGFLQINFYDMPNLQRFKMERKTELDFRNRLVSFVHGLVALVLSGYAIYFFEYGCDDQVQTEFKLTLGQYPLNLARPPATGYADR